MWRIILCLHRIFVKVKLVFQKVMTLVHVGGSGGKSELHLWIHRNANAFDVLKKTHSNNFVFTLGPTIPSSTSDTSAFGTPPSGLQIEGLNRASRSCAAGNPSAARKIPAASLRSPAAINPLSNKL